MHRFSHLFCCVSVYIVMFVVHHTLRTHEINIYFVNLAYYSSISVGNFFHYYNWKLIMLFYNLNKSLNIRKREQCFSKSTRVGHCVLLRSAGNVLLRYFKERNVFVDLLHPKEHCILWNIATERTPFLKECVFFQKKLCFEKNVSSLKTNLCSF